MVVSRIVPSIETEHRLSIISAKSREIIFNGVTMGIYNFGIDYCEPIDKWPKYRRDNSVILKPIY